MTHHKLAPLVGAVLLATACTKSGPTEASSPPKTAETKKAPPPSDAYDPAAALRDPTKAKLTAPETYVVELKTTKGDIRIGVTRAWAPEGADRFYNLVRAGYYDDTAFFRVIGGFMAQVGISGDPALNRVWRDARFPDDPVKESNRAGYVTFAAAALPNSRTTQFFINFGDNSRLDGMRFAPFGKVQDASMAVVRKLHAGYGEGAPRGAGPDQGRIQEEGNAYLRNEFPELDYIQTARVVDGAATE